MENNYYCRTEIECQEPIEVVSYKIGVCKVSPKGKDCSTVFKRLGYNPNTNTSVVLCKPKTGRMHQIRVHLQYLGKWMDVILFLELPLIVFKSQYYYFNYDKSISIICIQSALKLKLSENKSSTGFSNENHVELRLFF